MSTRKALAAALSLVVVTGGSAPAVAGPKSKPKPKPITAEYDVAGLPVPYDPFQGCVDDELEGISRTTRTIEPIGAGTLDVTVTKFGGDWDVLVFDEKGKVLGTGAGTTTPDAGSSNTEKLTLKTKKGMELRIAVCNFLGTPSAHVKYVFTYK